MFIPMGQVRFAGSSRTSYKMCDGKRYRRSAAEQTERRASYFFSLLVTQADLSRFGRDYIESGKYIEKIFPALGVRFIAINDNYTDATKITKRMVAELIDHIEVYPAVKEDGVANQRVTIHYNCIGVFEVPDRRKIPERDILLETRRGVALGYAPSGIAV